MASRPTREEAWKLLVECVPSDSLRRHALAVEGVMRFMTRRAGEDEDLWGLAGMAHDIDYERWPEQHCVKARTLLEEHGWPEELVRAVVSHGWGICSDEEPLSLMEKTLYAVDELTGLVSAAALVRPSRSVLDLPAKSVLKKWKDRSFAAGVNREVIEKGAGMLGMDLPTLTEATIEGMRAVAAEIGLKGNL